MEVDVEPCCSASSKNDSIKALTNSFLVRKSCEPSFLRKCQLTIRPLTKDEVIETVTSIIDLPIKYLEKLLVRTKFYEADPLNENECVDLFSGLIFSNNPFVSRNFNSAIIILQDAILNKPNQFQHQNETFHYFIPPNAIHYLSDYCPFGVEIFGKFDPFNLIVFKNYFSNNERDKFCQQAAKIMAACRKNELYFQYSTHVFLKPLPVKEFDCGLSIFEGFEMKPAKHEEDEFLVYQICPIQRVFFSPLSLDSAIQKCFEHPKLEKAFSHHCVSFVDQKFQYNNIPFNIHKIKFFDVENSIWNPDQNLYNIFVKEKHSNSKEMIEVWGPKYLHETYSSEDFRIIQFQECSVNFWPLEVRDFVEKSSSASPKMLQQKISSIIQQLNFLCGKESEAIKSRWHTQEIEIIKFPSILFRTESIVPTINGQFQSASNIPIIYGTKTFWIILCSNERYLQIFKPLINSIAISLSYRNNINISCRKIKNSAQLHAEIIKCNTVAEMFIIIDSGNITGLEESVIFSKTKNPDASIFILKLKDLKNLMNEREAEMAKLQRILNLKMAGLNHTPNYANFLNINSIDIKPNEILFLSHFFLAPQSSGIGTTGFAFNYMPIKCQPIGKISFQFTNRTQFYSLHKFCKFAISQIDQNGVSVPKVVFIGVIDNAERKEICEFNAKMDLNIIQKHFIPAALIYLSFTREHSFRGFVEEENNLPLGACIDDPIDENAFYLVTQQHPSTVTQPSLKIRILQNQPEFSKAAIKHYIFTQCFCNQISLQSDPFPSTLMFSMKLAQKGVNVIEALKKHSPSSFTGNVEDDARYCNKAIASQNIKYQCMDIESDDDIENEKRVSKSRKSSKQN